ncbi:microsomal epoxide hydrolase [Ranunculus cassubicifolius]
MDEIQHNYVDINGLKLHVAEIGTGNKVVIFLHGFPEIWYSWRYQMIAVANSGYRALAPDYRGYGLSQIPSQPQNTSFKHLIDDLLAILDHFCIPKAFIVGKDFGGRPAYYFSLLHPERVAGVVTLGVPYTPPGPFAFAQKLPEGCYISRWQKPGRAEADFGRLEVKTVVKNIYILFSKSDMPTAAENQEIMDLVEPSAPLPSWFTEEDLSNYAALYEKSGFRTPLQVPYRSLGENLSSIISDPIVKVPVLVIMGGNDYALKFPGMENYIRSGKVKEYVPDLEVTWLPQGSHFVQEQFPDKVNQLIITFLNNHIVAG